MPIKLYQGLGSVLDIYKMLQIIQTNCETMLKEFNQHYVVLSIGKTLDPNLEE